jgi:hypothetical protein
MSKRKVWVSTRRDFMRKAGDKYTMGYFPVAESGSLSFVLTYEADLGEERLLYRETVPAHEFDPG